MTVSTKVKLGADMKTKKFSRFMSNCPALKKTKKPTPNPQTKKAFQNKLPGEGTHWRGSKEKKRKN